MSSVFSWKRTSLQILAAVERKILSSMLSSLSLCIFCVSCQFRVVIYIFYNSQATIGDRAFPVAAASVWNSLPESSVQASSSLSVLHSRLQSKLLLGFIADADSAHADYINLSREFTSLLCTLHRLLRDSFCIVSDKCPCSNSILWLIKEICSSSTHLSYITVTSPSLSLKVTCYVSSETFKCYSLIDL